MQFIYKTNDVLKDICRSSSIIRVKSVWVTGSYHPPLFADMTVHCIHIGGSKATPIVYTETYKDAIHHDAEITNSQGILKLFDIHVNLPEFEIYTKANSESYHSDGILKLYDVNVGDFECIAYSTISYDAHMNEGILKLFDVNVNDVIFETYHKQYQDIGRDFMIQIYGIQSTIATIVDY